MIGAALAGEHPGLGERADDLLEEERVALAPLDQELPEGGQRPVGTQERLEQLVGARRRQRRDRDLAEAGPAPPVVLELGPVVDEQQEPRCPDPLEEAVEDRPGLGVDPLEVLEDQDERLAIALLQEEAGQRVEHAAPPLARVEGAERLILRQRDEERQDRRDRVVEVGVERPDLCPHLSGDLVRPVAVVQLEVLPEELDDRQVGGGLLV